MVHIALRRLLVALTLLALLGGTTVQAMPTVATAGDLVMNCAHMDMHPQGAPGHKQVPCNSNPLECLKQMACFGALSLPAPSAVHTPVSYDVVTYWPVLLGKAGRSIAPDPFPPIAA